MTTPSQPSAQQHCRTREVESEAERGASGWVGVGNGWGSLQSLSCAHVPTAERPPAQPSGTNGVRGRPVLNGSRARRAEPGRSVPLSHCRAWRTGPEPPRRARYMPVESCAGTAWPGEIRCDVPAQAPAPWSCEHLY